MRHRGRGALHMRRSRYATLYGPMLTALFCFGSIPTIFIFGASNPGYKILMVLTTVNVALMFGMRLEEDRWRDYLENQGED
jgi:hypothetical protein